MITGDSLPGARLLALIGVICLVGYRWATVKYSVFRTQAGNVLVIQDREHDRIVDEINRRRKDQLLALYGELDTRNTLEDEIAKFSWLHEQDVLSKEQLGGTPRTGARPFRRRAGNIQPASLMAVLAKRAGESEPWQSGWSGSATARPIPHYSPGEALYVPHWNSLQPRRGVHHEHDDEHTGYAA